MGEVLTTLVVGVGILLVTGVAIYFYQRSLGKPGGRDGLGAAGDMFGGLIEVFNPGEARAKQALKELENARHVTPTPDGADHLPVRLVTHPDGTPRAVRIRKPRPPV
jgi:hypothetical protein